MSQNIRWPQPLSRVRFTLGVTLVNIVLAFLVTSSTARTAILLRNA
ncbi:hypothetical protein [Methylobacterium sp. XJLW]|nr:hypothetical protein [Methylobacterium sp. XJLW]